MSALNSSTDATTAQIAHLTLLSACAHLTLGGEPDLLARLRTLTARDLAPLLSHSGTLDIGHGVYHADEDGLRWYYGGRYFPLWSCARGGLSTVVPIASWTEGWARTALTILGERPVAPTTGTAPMLKIGDTVAVKIADIKSVCYALSRTGDSRFFSVQLVLEPASRPVIPVIEIPWMIPTATVAFTPPETVPLIHAAMTKALAKGNDAVLPVILVTDAGGTTRYCFDYAKL